MYCRIFGYGNDLLYLVEKKISETAIIRVRAKSSYKNNVEKEN